MKNNDGQEKNKNPAIYGRIDVPSEEELREKTRDLDENQRRVIDTVVEYCRAVVKAREQGNELPKPRHMMEQQVLENQQSSSCVPNGHRKFSK